MHYRAVRLPESRSGRRLAPTVRPCETVLSAGLAVLTSDGAREPSRRRSHLGCVTLPGVHSRSLDAAEAELPERARLEAAAREVARYHAAHAEAARDLDDWVLCGCVTRLAAAYWLRPEKAPLPALWDDEGPSVPRELPPVVDAHVHFFPDPVFDALWRWFERYAWPIRYRLRTPDVARFLFDRGVSKIVGLHYPHKPGMADALNAYAMTEVDRRVAMLGTVFPKEAGNRARIEALATGERPIAGLKLHCHVQHFSVDDAEVFETFAAAEALDLAVIVHAGREPSSPAYPIDPHSLCGAERVGRLLRDCPRLRLVIPHLGADEYVAYGELLERYPGLMLDSTMTLAGYLGEAPTFLLERYPERILFGTDFPNLPYAWDRELRALLSLDLPESSLAAILGENAARTFGLTLGRSQA